MRTRWMIAALACLASATAGAADEPTIEFESHYGVMYAGRTFVHVDLRGAYDKKFMIHPKVWIEMVNSGPCSDGSCTTHSTTEDFTDPGPLIGVLNAGRKHLADGTDFTYHLGPVGCERVPEVDVQVDGKARTLRLTMGPVSAEFDPDEVDYFLGMVQPAFDRLMIVQPQFDAFNAASPLNPPAPKPMPTCGGARPAKPPTAS